MKSPLVRLACASACLVALCGAVLAQSAPQAPSATLVQAPASPVAPPPTDTPQRPPVPVPSAPRGAMTTLVPEVGDTGDVDEVVLPAKPVIVMAGQTNWENGLKTMRASVAHLREEAARAGLAVAGRPVTVFTETSDDGFKYDAMLPVAAPPAPGVTLPPEVRAGTTPSGKAYRFVHKGPYDEIDTTYETITAYLDAKDIAARDTFVEEYLTDTADPTDPALEINIFVQPK